jgi:hypothetical protein
MKALPLPDDIKELMTLVRAGKLFDVQKWIAEGKRIVPPPHNLAELHRYVWRLKPNSTAWLRYSCKLEFNRKKRIIYWVKRFGITIWN